MMTKDLADQVRADVKSLKAVADRFLLAYRQVVADCVGPNWRKEPSEKLFHQARMAIIPIMEEEGMDPKAVQALLSWAERHLVNQ